MTGPSVVASGMTMPVNRAAIPTVVFVSETVYRAIMVQFGMMPPGPAMFVMYWFIPLLIMTCSIMMMATLFSCCK